jgi:SPP1 gp7 family putative phage head morphogenesis protein
MTSDNITDKKHQKKLEGLINDNTKDFEHVFNAYFHNVGSSFDDYVGDGYLSDLENYKIPGEVQEKTQSEISKFVGTFIVSQWMLSGTTAKDSVASGISKLTNSQYEPTTYDRYFDNWVQSRSGELITNFTNEQLDAFRSVMLYHSQEAPVSAYELANELKSFTGLTVQQTNALLRVQTVLAEQGLSDSAIQKAMDKRTKQMKTYRAQRIARTEIATAYNQASNQVIFDAIGSGVLTGNIKKKWLAARDEKTCDICGELDGLEVDLNETFPGGYDLAGYDTHPNCRCTIIHIIERG